MPALVMCSCSSPAWNISRTIVGAADKLALDVKLRDGRPVGVILDALAQLVAFENVGAAEFDAEILQNLYDLAGEAALRKVRGALHEQEDVVGLDGGVR